MLVPNFTTSGYGMTPEIAKLCKRYCGAVAVSWYRSEYTISAIQTLIDAGVKTNIHYVLSKNSIEEAVERLSGKGFPEGINAVIFLMHKPVGQGERDNMITHDNPYLKKFCDLVNNSDQKFKIGFDSCSVPMIVNYCPTISKMTLDTCEGGRYSCYISSEMVMSPCSFDREEKYGVSLRGRTIREVWNSQQFDRFRNSLEKSCPDCKDREFCMGGCPLVPEVALCDSKCKKQIYGGKI
jgi:radical SAM protein with 4Fe4S-binding SPASM domain